MLACAVACAVLLTSACGSGDPLPNFDFRIQFNTDGLHGCLEDDCSKYGLACGAILGFRIVDAEFVQNESGNLEPANVYVDKCVRVSTAENVCALGGLDIGQLPMVPAKMLQLQMALWSPDELGIAPGEFVTAEHCPKNVFDLQGIPRMDGPQPAFGGAVYFRAGENAFVDIPLACPNPGAVHTVECQPSTTVVTVKVDDLETTTFVPPSQALTMTVSIAKPTERAGGGGPEWIIENANSHDLTLDTEALIPEWMDAVMEDFGNTACVLALDGAETNPTTSAHCTEVNPFAAALPDMRGFLVSETDRTRFLAALGLPGLPAQGLVVGRVVDQFGTPQAGAKVVPLAITSTVRYLSSDGLTTTTTTTGPSGYFFVEDAPFGTEWTASVDTRTEDGTFLAGLLVGKISVVQIKLTPPVEG